MVTKGGESVKTDQRTSPTPRTAQLGLARSCPAKRGSKTPSSPTSSLLTNPASSASIYWRTPALPVFNCTFFSPSSWHLPDYPPQKSTESPQSHSFGRIPSNHVDQSAASSRVVVLSFYDSFIAGKGVGIYNQWGSRETQVMEDRINCLQNGVGHVESCRHGV